jgi:hypothetical protein
MEENPYRSPPPESLETKKRTIPPRRWGRRRTIAVLFIAIGLYLVHDGMKAYPIDDEIWRQHPQMRDHIRRECATEAILGIGIAVSGIPIWLYRSRFKAKKD